MNAEVDPKIIKIEPEEESKLNLFLITQRFLCVNNDIKEEICYDSSNTNLNNNCFEDDQSNSNCVTDNHINKEFSYCSSKTNFDNKFEGVQEEDNISNYGNQNSTTFEKNTSKNSRKLTASIAFSQDPSKLKHQNYKSNVKYNGDLHYSTSARRNLTTLQAEQEDVIHKSDQCDYSTKRKRNLTIHQGTHKLTTYKCDKCDFSTLRKSSLKTHYAKHSGVTYKCERCDYSTYSKSILIIHYDKHKCVIHNCDDCDYSPKSKRNPTCHQRKHIGMNYKCDKCDFSTNKKKCLDMHLVKYKGAVHRSYQCYNSTQTTNRNLAICQDEQKDVMHKYNSSTIRKDLIAYSVEHTDFMYKCEQCNYGTEWKNDFKVHCAKHKDVYKCAECDYSSILKQDLILHCTEHTIKRNSLTKTNATNITMEQQGNTVTYYIRTG